MSDVEIVRKICKERKIPISLLEKECGFSNGYLNPKKAPKRIPYERSVSICQYLNIPLSTLGYEIDLVPESPRVISDEELRFALWNGKPATEAQLKEVKNFAAFIMERDEGKHEK